MKEDIEIQQSLAQMFPYNPYPTQLKLSVQLYQNLKTVSENKVIMIESPTGTGKTYALLAATLKWLKDNPHQIAITQFGKPENNQQDSQSYPSWIAKPSKIKQKQLIQQKIDKMKKIKTLTQYKSQKNQTRNKRTQIKQQKVQWEQIDDDQKDLFGKRAIRQTHISLKLQQQQKQCLPKIIFTSRTHTQLAQVIESFNKMSIQQFKIVALASKDHLCVHPKVQKNKVHQKCQYLLSHGGCPYYHHQSIQDFFNLSIPETKKLGQINHICSYYGVKNISGVADILCVPYISILNSQIRQKLNINLNNSIIIFDEAHNIIQQQLNMRSPQLSYNQLQKLQKRISEYLTKYGKKMSQNNFSLIEHMQTIIKNILKIIQEEYKRINNTTNNNQQYVKMNKIQFLVRMNLLQIKLFQIKNYIALSNFDQKLCFFTQQSFSMSVLNTFIQFLVQLLGYGTTNTNKQMDSAIVIIKNLKNNNKSVDIVDFMEQNTSIKILCLQSPQLKNIFKKSRCSILAGGTMQPIQPIVSILEKSQISYKFTKYPHIIKQNQCQVFIIPEFLTENSQKKYIKFTHNQIKNKQNLLTILHQTKKIIQKVIKKTEKNSGTVIFVQNYSILKDIFDVLGMEILNYQIFYDSKHKKDNIFQSYQKQITINKKSAVLISVMGGKLSQGINFSDKLARSIIVLGLPYPNIMAPQMVQKMKYLNNKASNTSATFQSSNKLTNKQFQPENGQQYYQNCCIKALNQTIGRGIRHKDDYAKIYLIDSRFEQIGYKLSSWLTKCIKKNNLL